MPSDYTTLANVRTALKIQSSNTDEDAFLTTLITRASRAIDKEVNRWFVGETQTRKFDAVEDVDGNTLLLDADLVSITSITNGDGNTIPSTNYTLLPTNHTPKYAVKIKGSSSTAWTWQDDPEEAIEIAGSWGYSAGTPDDIQQACIRIVVWNFKQRDVPFLEVGLPEGGFSPVSVTIPNDIKNLLSPYIRKAIK